MIIESICYEKTDNLVTRKIAGETILVPVSSNVGDLESIYTLNEVGSRIWELIDGKTSLKVLKDKIQTEFDVPEDIVEQDIQEIVSSLEQAGFLCICKG